MKNKIITAFKDNHRDLVISKKTGQFEDVLYNTGYETAMLFVLGLMGISKEEALNMKEIKEEIKMKEVAIIVKNGLVQEVYGTDKTMDARVIDLDETDPEILEQLEDEANCIRAEWYDIWN